MSHTYAANFFHCVFSTKGRRDLIPDEFKTRLWAYIHGIATNLSVNSIAVGGTANHAHVLVELKPSQAIAEIVQKIKANSSRWMGEHGLAFEWQKGYATFTVSSSSIDAVRAYVLNQEEHHRKRSFEEEFVALLKKAGIAYVEDSVFAA